MMAFVWATQPVHYTTATILQEWTAAINSFSINTATIPRTGTACVRAATTSTSISKTLGGLQGEIVPSGNTAIIGFRYRQSALGSLTGIVQLLDSGTAQVTLHSNSDGTLTVRRGTASGTSLGTSTAALSTGTFYYIEFKAVIDDAVGTVDVYVDNVNVLTLTGQDTKNTANATWNSFNIGINSAGGATTMDQFWTDMYVLDGSDGTLIGQIDTFSAVLGDVKCEYLAAQSGNGTNTGWTTSTGSDHGALVDDGASGPNGDTDYNQTAGAGNKDTYNLANLATTAVTVLAVCPKYSVTKDDAGSKFVAPVYRVSGTDYLSAASVQCPSPGAYSFLTEIVTKSPATSLPWTPAEVNAMEAGLQVTA